MKAAVLFEELKIPNLPDIDIVTLTESSALADSSSVFVCIRGAHNDGHAFAAAAYDRGCRLFVAESPLSLPPDACVILTPNTKHMLGILASRFYGDPSKQMHVVGITGTKGKTTVAQLLTHLLNASKIPCGYIGTNGVQYLGRHIQTRNTTPDAVTLQSTLRDMLDAGVRTVVAEVSSQAILCERVAGMTFKTTVFTNLSPDHIGKNEHRDFADYKACKHRLFTDFGASYLIFNADDPYAEELTADSSADHRVSISVQKPADYSASELRLLRERDLLGVSFTLSHAKQTLDASLPLTGKMNVENALSALAVASECFSIPLADAVPLLTDARVAGRSEVYPLPNDACAVIDYAHNGESLRRLLTTLREYRPTRLIALFGSVGERSQMRRRELGRAAAELCDLCILTSDNPGTEPPEEIIAEIASAFDGTDTPYLTIPDRAEAIQTAVELCRAGDLLVLAGKGHEAYQLIGKEKVYFCERELLGKAAAICST